MVEEDYFFACPCCGEELSIRLDPSGGRKQRFIQDCEICCRPMEIEVQFQGGEVDYFSAVAEAD